MQYKFDCGCTFDIVEEKVKDCDGLPGIHIDFYNIREDCPITWDLLKSGKTKGVFQLETNLGKKWSKQALPNNIAELSALIALMRPGVLKAMVNVETEDEDEPKQKSMAQLYCDRKNLGEPIEYLHEDLKPILKETQGILLYQEESMKIAQDIAGFNLEEADSLRKSIGKKLPALMAKIKTQFIDGCATKKNVSQEQAEQIFGWIQESQRYSFNASHSVSYSTIGYWSAYVKAHFPLHFFTSWLYYANEKIDPQEEMQKLISDAKTFDISVCPPTLKEIRNGDPGHFSMKNNTVYFGIGDIKRIGQSHINKVFVNVDTVEQILGRKIQQWSWYDFLVFFSDYVSTTVVNGLIAAGATDYMGKTRNQKIHEYNEWKKLTVTEKKWIKENCNHNTNLLQSIKEMCRLKNKLSSTRKNKILDIIKILNNPVFSLEDDAYFIAHNEQELLGIALTCSKLDTCSNKIMANSTCKELLEGKTGKFSICVEIVGVNEYIIKKGKSKGQKMLFLQVEDDTALLDSLVVFPNVIEGNEAVLINGSTVFLEGERDNNYHKDSFIVENVILV
jgi:DNA polymerase-3 subunit alpha